MSPYGPYAAGYQFPNQQQQVGTGFGTSIQNFVSAGGLQPRTTVGTNPTFRLGTQTGNVQPNSFGGRTSSVPTAVAARGGNPVAARSVR